MYAIIEPARRRDGLRIFSHDELSVCDLVVDAIYEGGTANNVSDDVISKLLPGTGNRGGFRPAGRGPRKNFVILYTSGRDPDWPDSFDPSTGRFIYWGDNKRPGHGLHETRRGGNKLLRDVFGAIGESGASRENVPPFLIFHSNPTSRSSWSVRFLGLAVPGCPDTSTSDTLVALWRSTEGQRFQNYRAVFTVLDVPVVSRLWVKDLLERRSASKAAPEAWRKWVSSGRYLPLVSTPTSQIRTADQQLPSEPNHRALLRAI